MGNNPGIRAVERASAKTQNGTSLGSKQGELQEVQGSFGREDEAE